MKKIFIILSLLFSAHFTFAQSSILNIGLKGGVGSSKFTFDESALASEADREASWHVGLMARIKIPVFGIYVQPEVYYSRTQGQIEVLQGLGGNESFSQDRIDIPVLLGWRLGLDVIAIRFNAGVVGIIMLDNGLDDLSNTLLETETNDFIWGYQAGVGVDFWKLSFDARYEGNFNKFIEESAGVNIDGRINQWVFSLGYWF
ncbi:porin family protein [Sediminitomix flava]|uniref:Outer membrane protein with beta-barrel domain n=1 Tax=Sediminitomix flava TaxID=379075 RepID=A0A315ZF26_SEDFL|nr:porin family protein [Sediminitomix flava]PWJ44186.1 outer membrane protein with beta-barrel domain [Sediminitomix flava]